MDIDTILQSFEFLEDWEDRYALIIDLGRRLEPMPDEMKTEVTRVLGCQSQVWIAHRVDEAGHVHFVADSDAHIVRGLIGILMALYDDRTPAEILATPAAPLFDRLGLQQHLSPLRSNGLHAMVRRIHELAAAAA